MQSNRHCLIADRYELGEKRASTALGDVFYAYDFISGTADESLHPVILFAVAPQVVAYPGFYEIMPKIIAEFGKTNPLLQVVGACEDRGVYWIAIDEHHQALLIDHLPQREHAEPASTMDNPQPLLIKVLDAVKRLSPKQGFGFIEPGAILCVNNTFKLINAPVAFALQILASHHPDKKPDIALHSSYCSPQVAHGLTPVPQDDTFAIGCIAYHILHGAPPFATLSTLEAYAQQQTPQPLTSLKPESQHSLQRAIALERYERQASPYELLHAFVSVPSDATSDDSAGLTGIVARFRPLPTTVALAIVLLLGAGGYHVYQQPKLLLTDPAVVATQHHESTLVSESAVALPENRTTTPEPVLPLTPPTIDTTPALITTKSTPAPAATPRQNAQPSKAAPSVAHAPPPEKPVPTTTARQPPQTPPATSVTVAPSLLTAPPPVATPAPNVTTQTAAAPPPSVTHAPALPATPLSGVTHSPPPAPRPPPATPSATVVIPVAENTFVVGQTVTPSSPPARKVQISPTASANEHVFVVAPD